MTRLYLMRPLAHVTGIGVCYACRSASDALGDANVANSLDKTIIATRIVQMLLEKVAAKSD